MKSGMGGRKGEIDKNEPPKGEKFLKRRKGKGKEKEREKGKGEGKGKGKRKGEKLLQNGRNIVHKNHLKIKSKN